MGILQSAGYLYLLLSQQNKKQMAKKNPLSIGEGRTGLQGKQWEMVSRIPRSELQHWKECQVSV